MALPHVDLGHNVHMTAALAGRFDLAAHIGPRADRDKIDWEAVAPKRLLKEFL
jgi:hypothetical protein